MNTFKNLRKLEEYVNKRNQAFESKLFEDIENPLPVQHFCNNQKYLDAFSQDIIHGNNQLNSEDAGVQEMLYNTLVHRVLLNKEFCKNNTDKYGIFRLNDYEDLKKNIKDQRSFPGRYRNMMANVHLTKMDKDDFFDKIITTILPELERFNNCYQSEIYTDEQLRRNGYQCGDFTQYQLSSDLLYVPKLTITPDYVTYCSHGTALGTHHCTDEWAYSKELIDTILEINKGYDHKTELTEVMIPSDANNVICEFYKYSISKKTRYRKPEVVTHPELSYEVPENLRRFKNV